MASWGTEVWIAFGIVVAVQATLITILLVTFAKTAVNLQALGSDNNNGQDSVSLPQD